MKTANRNGCNKSTRQQALGIPGLLLAAVTILLSCEMNDLKVYIVQNTGFTGQIYVDISRGSDEAPGTKAEPLSTIRAGITRGQWYLDQELAEAVEVLAAEGTYEQHDTVGVRIQMVEGISLYGGFSSDFSVRNPSIHETRITDVSVPGDGGEDVATVRAENGITTDTVIDGFTIVGGAAALGGIDRAIHVDAASPTISNNTVEAGNSYIAIDIYRDSDPIVLSNTIVGSDEDLAWKTAVMVSDNSLARFYDNSIDGGTSGTCIGVTFWETRCYDFADNTVYGGAGTSTTGINIIEDSSVTISNNIIDGGDADGDVSIGIRISTLSSLSATGNQITVSSTNSGSKGIESYNGEWITVESNEIFCNSSDDVEGIGVSESGFTSIRSNTVITTGAAGESSGIAIFDTDCEIRSNLVNNGHTTGSESNGISLNLSTNSQVIGNTISSGSSTGFSFGISISSCSPQIDNNIIFTTGGTNQKAIHEHDVDSHVRYLRNNVFYRYHPNMVLFFDWEDTVGAGGVELNDIPTMESTLDLKPQVDEATGNRIVNPEFEDEEGSDSDIDTQADNDWNLSDSTPTSITEGGLWLGAGDIDLMGRPRTNPSSIGAYEHDGG